MERIFCKHCNDYRVFKKDPVNHILHLLLSLFLCGFWFPIWILIAISKGLESPYCEQCGWKEKSILKQGFLITVSTIFVIVIYAPIILSLANYGTQKKNPEKTNTSPKQIENTSSKPSKQKENTSVQESEKEKFYAICKQMIVSDFVKFKQWGDANKNTLKEKENYYYISGLIKETIEIAEKNNQKIISNYKKEKEDKAKPEKEKQENLDIIKKQYKENKACMENLNKIMEYVQNIK